MKEYLADIKCQVCGNTNPELFTDKFEKDGNIVVECKNCSFVFIPPYFRKKITYSNYKNEDVLNQIKQGNDWFKLQRHYLRYQLIRKYIKKGKLFDLGVGWGHFLLAGKNLGFEISGIEVSEMPYRYAKENLHLPVELTDFFVMDYKKEEYDLITLWDVLEHIDEADKAVAQCAAMLKKGGYLVIQVPQIDSYIAKKKKVNWNMIGLDHVNYFSTKTLPQLMAKHGLETVRVKASIELKLLLMYNILPWVKRLRGQKKVTNAQISSAERQAYFNKATKLPKWVLSIVVFFHNITYNTLSALNIGEEMIVIARKK